MVNLQLTDLTFKHYLKEVLGSGLLSFCFCFKSDGSIDTMIKVPPITQKVMVVPHKIDGVEENIVLG